MVEDEEEFYSSDEAPDEMITEKGIQRGKGSCCGFLCCSRLMTYSNNNLDLFEDETNNQKNKRGYNCHWKLRFLFILLILGGVGFGIWWRYWELWGTEKQ